MIDTTRPIFVPAKMRPTPRPTGAEAVEMKRAVIERDGYAKGCYWCKRPFVGWYDSTLEHIIPLADGGKHALSNCALACEECNSRNVPMCVRAQQVQSMLTREETAKVNTLANGGPVPDCDIHVQGFFNGIARQRGSKLLERGEAAVLLRNIHRVLGRQEPTKAEWLCFKGHYNRWSNEQFPQPQLQPCP